MVWVLKHSGEREEFDLNKVTYALMRSGASKKLAEDIAETVKSQIYDGIATGKVYKIAFDILHKYDLSSATRFGLKLAIMRMGPSGYPFEKYVARILAEHGYTTKTNQFLSGCDVEHEIDVIAEKEGKVYMVECKYHNQFGFASGLKEAMYTYARFMDLRDAGSDFTHPWLVTNTKITEDAINYGLGKQMKLTAWGHPETENLQQLIEGEIMYPVTILRHIDDKLKNKLMDNGFITVKDIVKCRPEEIADIASISVKAARKMTQELLDILPPK